MRRAVLLSVLSVPLLALPSLAADDGARARVQASVEAMGGEARLRALSSLRIQGLGHWNLMEQSERPAPPWLVMYEQVDELRVPAQRRLRQKTERRGSAGLATWKALSLVMDGDVVAVEREGKFRPAGGAQLQDMRARLYFAPERVLLTALDAADLRAAPDTQHSGVGHRRHRQPAQPEAQPQSVAGTVQMPNREAH